MGVVINRFEVWLTALDPTIGSEMQKTRPCLVVSPDALNRHLLTAIVAPLTTAGRSYAYRPECSFQGKRGWIALDQLRTVDKSRFIKRLGNMDAATNQSVLMKLALMFAP